MRYNLADLPLHRLIEPVTRATASITRLDERIAQSPIGEGWIERSHFGDAVSSLWVDGELVHVEDLVLHDAAMGIRAPTHELTIAHDILRTRRRILEHEPGWALSRDGWHRLRGGSGEASPDAVRHNSPLPMAEVEPPDDDAPDALDDYLAEIDAALARSEAAISRALEVSPKAYAKDRDPLIYEPDWDEDERLEEWRVVVEGSASLPPVLRAAVILDAWNTLEVLQHAPWLGRLLAASLLRREGVTTTHLLALNVGLRRIGRELRSSRSRDTRLLAIVDGMAEAADLGLNEHHRLVLARQQMQHRLVGRRQSSKLPLLVDLVLSRPVVSSGMIAKSLQVTPQGALKVASQLQLRELTGRGRFRAWGII